MTYDTISIENIKEKTIPIISVKTLDLDSDFNNIKCQLVNLVRDWIKK